MGRFTYLSVAALVPILAACAPQTIISNERQAVIESWSATDAVAQAEKECAKTSRIPMLERQTGSEYWFTCIESERAAVQRQREAQEAAMRQAEALRASLAPPPAMPAAGTPETAKPEPKPVAAAGTKPMPRGTWVQVGAFRSKTVGEKFLADMRKAHAGIVRGHNLTLVRSESRGLYLGRLGPYANGGAARQACAAIKARGAGCFIVQSP